MIWFLVQRWTSYEARSGDYDVDVPLWLFRQLEEMRRASFLKQEGCVFLFYLFNFDVISNYLQAPLND